MAAPHVPFSLLYIYTSVCYYGGCVSKCTLPSRRCAETCPCMSHASESHSVFLHLNVSKWSLVTLGSSEAGQRPGIKPICWLFPSFIIFYNTCWSPLRRRAPCNEHFSGHAAFCRTATATLTCVSPSLSFCASSLCRGRGTSLGWRPPALRTP